MKKTLLALLILISIILGSSMVIWNFPHLIVTPQRVHTLVHQTLGFLFSMPPEKVNLNISSYGFTGKHISISSGRFCLKEPEVCFEKIHVEFSFKWVGLTRFRIEELGPVEVINESFTLRNSEESETIQENDSNQKTWRDYIEIPTGLKLASLKVLAPKIEIIGADSVLKADLNLSGENVNNILLLANAKSSDGLEAKLTVVTGFVGGVKSPFKAKVLVKDEWSIDGNLEGEIQWDTMNIALHGNAKLTKLVSWIHTLELQNLEITRDQDFHLNTDVAIKLEPKLSFAERDSAIPKASFTTEVQGKFEVVQSSTEGSYDYSLKVGPNTHKGLHLNALLKGTYPFPKGEEYRFGLKDLFTEIKIPKFQTLVENFKRTNSAIPAPFSALKGSITLQVGRMAKSIIDDKIPLILKTELTSPEQTIQTSSDGEITFKKGLKNISLVGKTDLNKIIFTMPAVDPIQPPPALKRDSRIHSLVETAKKVKVQKDKKIRAQARLEKGSVFELDWNIQSKNDSIRIYYDLCRPYIPVNVQLKIKEDGTTGKVSVLPLDLHYQSRDAHVEYFNYNLGKNLTSLYDGKLVVQKTDYTIMIGIVEKEGKPRVSFSSNPPLDENDIISVLLFNQTSAQLSPDESNSVSSTKSAMANRALGLFSIFALSSTPIEAVSYNAASGVYAARVKLAAGLTATVGTDWEKTQEVALRKRIGKNFVLSTVFEQEGESNDRTTKTLIEWFRRF